MKIVSLMVGLLILLSNVIPALGKTFQDQTATMSPVQREAWLQGYQAAGKWVVDYLRADRNVVRDETGLDLLGALAASNLSFEELGQQLTQMGAYRSTESLAELYNQLGRVITGQTKSATIKWYRKYGLLP